VEDISEVVIDLPFFSTVFCLLRGPTTLTKTVEIQVVSSVDDHRPPT